MLRIRVFQTLEKMLLPKHMGTSSYTLDFEMLDTQVQKVSIVLHVLQLTVAHNCHGKLKLTTANLKFTAANSNSPRQIQIHRGKFKFATANSNSPRQIQIHHGKFKFTMAKIQIHHSKFKIHHSKFKFTMAKIQIHHSKFKIHHGKFKFTTANSDSPRQIQRACLLFVMLQELGLSFGGLGLVLVVRASSCRGLRGLYRFLWA